MSEVAAEHEEREQDDLALVSDARRLGVPFQVYVQMTERERIVLKARWAHSLKAEARRRGLEPEAFVATDDEGRDELRAEHPEQPRVRKTAAKPKAAAKAPPEPEPEPEPQDDVPEAEMSPQHRDHMTIVAPDAADLVGTSPPKHLEELFARWPVGDGQHFVRVERTQPKIFQNIPVAGMVGKILSPITEEEFQRYFGGREYEVTVWGPDPTGRHDPNTGLPSIKRKTEPIKVYVPHLNPNLSVLPAVKPSPREENAMSVADNPFQTLFGAGRPPATPADAQMHKTDVDFMQTIIKSKDAEIEAARNAQVRGEGSVLHAVTETNKSAIAATKELAQAQLATVQTQLDAERAARAKLEEKLDKLTEELKAKPQQNSAKDIIDVAKEMHPKEQIDDALRRQGQAHTEELRRVTERCDETVKHMKIQHEDTLRVLGERHAQELTREKNRYEDLETTWKRKYDDLRERTNEREKELKDEVARVREDERKAAETRVKETEKRFEDRIKDVKEQHERELRMKDEHAKTRLDTQSATAEMKLETAKAEAERAREEADEARREAEDAKDPIKVKENAEKLAEAFGYEKGTEGKQTTGQRLASTIGMGIGKALEDLPNWLPKTLKEMQDGRAARPGAPPGGPGQPGQLPPGPRPPAPPPQQPRGVAWASKAAVRVGVHGVPVEPAMPPQQQAPQQQPPPVQQQPQPVQQPEAPAPPHQAAGPNGQSPLSRAFSPELVAGFRVEAERAIETGFAPDLFASRFAEAYPEPSKSVVTTYSVADVLAAIESLPGGASSPVLRRDGRKWLESMWTSLQQAHGAA